jgi:hypothetical protein
MRPIRLPEYSVNQTLPSGPTSMSSGWLLAVGIGNSVTVPAVVMRVILFASSRGRTAAGRREGGGELVDQLTDGVAGELTSSSEPRSAQ